MISDKLMILNILLKQEWKRTGEACDSAYPGC